jgi:threonine dehydrogenase-like Zn-dependent dehydrogenase
MRQSRWTSDGLELFEVEAGPVPAGQARIRVAACGICGSDLHRWHAPAHALGGVPGHEVVGWVEEGPSGLRDCLYAIEPRFRCETCVLCRSGKSHLCEQGGIFGVHAPGGLADWIDVPTDALHEVPAGVDPVLASMAEPLAVAVRACHQGRIQARSRVLVLGAGAIGLLCGLVARDRGARVGITARHAHQRQAALRLGLEALDEAGGRDWLGAERPQSVIETVGGKARTLEDALEACASAGRVVVLGLFTQAARIDAMRLMERELELVGSNTYGHEHGSEFAEGVALLERYAGELALLQTHRFPLEALTEAFTTADDKRSGAIKVTLTTAT